MVNSGSKVSITEFNTLGNALKTPEFLTTDNIASFKNSYSAANGVVSDGFTNWDNGLNVADDSFAQFSNGYPDMFVIITDGNPNRYGSPAQTSSNFDNIINPAIARANTYRSNGVHMFGVAVGSSVKIGNIQTVTGPTALAANGSNFLSARLSNTDSYSTLTSQMRALATALCGSRVNVTKLAQQGATDAYTAASGFTFEATVTLASAGGTWTLPSAGAIVANTASTKSATTNGSGSAAFGWKPNASTAANVVLKEVLTPTPGRSLHAPVGPGVHADIGNRHGQQPVQRGPAERPVDGVVGQCRDAGLHRQERPQQGFVEGDEGVRQACWADGARGSFEIDYACQGGAAGTVDAERGRVADDRQRAHR